MFIKVGAWKNVDELEESLTLVELDFIIKAVREDKKETNVFLASLQGVDLSKYYENSVEDRLREVERQAAEKLHGKAAVDRQEFQEFGLVFETEEE